MEELYPQEYFAAHRAQSRCSASVVVPLVLRLLPGVRSAIDLGCGSGEWLAEFHANGVREVTGIDWADAATNLLSIAPECFYKRDATNPEWHFPRHDLAISVEVAEHLPSSGAEPLVRHLCSLSDVIVFSAAIPGQRGYLHINEQWPGYWIRLFKACGYDLIDILRPVIWKDTRVAWWYRQNLFLFCKAGLPGSERLKRLPTFGGHPLIHPECYLARISSVPPADSYDALWDNAGDEGAAGRPSEDVGASLTSSERRPARYPIPRMRLRELLFHNRLKRLLRSSGLFDANWYLRTYSDVAESGCEPVKHYLLWGGREGRDPGPDFATETYLSTYPYVAASGSNPLVHYLLHGRAEGRIIQRSYALPADKTHV
jgi:SAM-dependent methyltransferase